MRGLPGLGGGFRSHQQFLWSNFHQIFTKDTFIHSMSNFEVKYRKSAISDPIWPPKWGQMGVKWDRTLYLIKLVWKLAQRDPFTSKSILDNEIWVCPPKTTLFDPILGSNGVKWDKILIGWISDFHQFSSKSKLTR